MHTLKAFITDLDESFAMPSIYLQLRKLMDNATTPIGEFEKLVESDARLATGTIRFANSAFFDFDRKTDNLYEAINLMGIGQLHDFLFSCLCLRVFCNRPELEFNFDDFWCEQLKRGIAARSIAKFCRLPASNRFFTLGLLLEIGHAALFAKTPGLITKSLQESQQLNQPIRMIERKYIGFDYCELGSALLQRWRSPDPFPQVIEHYLKPENASISCRKETDVAHLAHHLCASADNSVQVNSLLKNHYEQVFLKNKILKDIDLHLEETYTLLHFN